MNKFLLLIIISGLLTISCKNEYHAKLCSDLEVYSSKLDSSIIVMEKLNASNFHNIYSEMAANIENYNKTIDDSSSLSTVINDVGRYASLSKYFKKTGRKHKSIYDELVISKSQIGLLKNDIENDVLEPERVDKYYKEEIKIADMLIDETVRMSNLAESNLILLDSLNLVVINLQDSIK